MSECDREMTDTERPASFDVIQSRLARQVKLNGKLRGKIDWLKFYRVGLIRCIVVAGNGIHSALSFGCLSRHRG